MPHWEILPTIAVRATGFAFELVEQLRFERTTGYVRAILAIEARMAGLRSELLERVFPDAVRQAYTQPDAQALLGLLSGWRRAVGRRRPVERPVSSAADLELLALLEQWNTLLGEHAETLDAARQSWQAELAERRHYLARVAGDSAFQEAIFLSNPDMYAALTRYLANRDAERPRSSAIRKFERRLAFYLQRFCAKNETQSFFGPINYGRFEPAHPRNITLRRAPEPIRRRVTFPAQWLAEALAAAMSQEDDLALYLAPRRETTCVLVDSRIVYFPAGNKRIELEAGLARLFQAADGRRTVTELAADFGQAAPDTWEHVRQLQQIGALVATLIVPPDLSDPLAYLEEWLARIPEPSAARSRWGERLAAVRAMLSTFAAAGLPERAERLAELESYVAELCGNSTRRGAGSMYADRMLLFEECLGDLEECTLGGSLARRMAAQLQSILDLSLAYGRLQVQRDQRIARGIWERLARPSQAGVPLFRYLHAFSQGAHGTGPAEPDQLDQFMVALRDVVQQQGDQGRVALEGADLPLPELPAEADACLYSSLDVMLAAPDIAALQRGDYKVVLGEIHPPPLVWVFPTAHFAHEAGQAIGPALAAALASQPGAAAAAQLAPTRKNKIFPYPLPGAQIELRPRYADCRAIPAAAVEIRDTPDGLRLWAGGQARRLYTPLKRQAGGLDPIAPFAFPPVQAPGIDCGEHTPRIEIDGVVYQRERWAFGAGAPVAPEARNFDLFLEYWRWKERHGLPDEVFVRVPEEPKPVYIDFASFLLVEVLDYLARPASRMTITEMFPTSRQLWLTRGEGRYCCEFRIMVVGTHTKPSETGEFEGEAPSRVSFPPQITPGTTTLSDNLQGEEQ